MRSAERRDGEQIINPAAYTLNGFQLGANGTAERGDCTGPGYFQADLAFYKNFRLDERRQDSVPLGHLQPVQQH